jgi:hypothetical protein
MTLQQKTLLAFLGENSFLLLNERNVNNALSLQSIGLAECDLEDGVIYLTDKGEQVAKEVSYIPEETYFSGVAQIHGTELQENFYNFQAKEN